MRRRELVLGFGGLAVLLPRAWAHHGWSSFDQDNPIYLEGSVLETRWQNPHVELMVQLPQGMQVPPDLAQRKLPSQSAPVDGPALLAKASLPRRSEGKWELELAPLTRMQAWQVPQIPPGATLSAVGFTTRDTTGEAVMRVEYLFYEGKAYGLRSSPA